MKVLVTGAAGFLGAALVERLLARGERDVRCLVRSGSAAAKLRAIAARHPDANLECFAGSLESADSAARALDGAGAVYHLAASSRGAAADIFLDTVVASKNLLEAVAASRRSTKMVLVSSFGVYGFAGLARGVTVDEATPLEANPEQRDPYSQAKLRQERLFRDYAATCGFPLVVLRPGVIYGCGGTPVSPRVGLAVAGVFLFLGGTNLLPLTYVDSCADAVALAGQSDAANGEIYNVVDDDLITAREFLARYQREVRRLRVVPLPYGVLRLLSHVSSASSRWSRGLLPAPITPYRAASAWKPTRFDNSKLKALGWRPLVSTDEGLRRAFEHHRRAITT